MPLLQSWYFFTASLQTHKGNSGALHLYDHEFPETISPARLAIASSIETLVVELSSLMRVSSRRDVQPYNCNRG